MRRYGFVELISVIMSLARSRDKSVEMKQLRPLSATPASNWCCAFRSLRIILVVSISSSESAWKHWLAARYPMRLHVNFGELITSMMLKPAHEMSYPIIWICTGQALAV